MSASLNGKLCNTEPVVCLHIDGGWFWTGFAQGKVVLWDRSGPWFLYQMVTQNLRAYAVCPRSSDPFYVVTYYTEWVTTSWTYSMYRNTGFSEIDIKLFATALDLNKCLKQIKLPISHNTWAPIFWVTIKYKYHGRGHGSCIRWFGYQLCAHVRWNRSYLKVKDLKTFANECLEKVKLTVSLDAQD